MLREGWNFHCDIALRLEGDARDLLNLPDRPVDLMFDADAIQHSTFVECMILLLRLKTKFTHNDEIDAFVSKCNSYMGVSGYNINPKVAQSLYNEFQALFC